MSQPDSQVRPSEDHRTRIGMERRSRTRARLLRGALLVFADHGADASVIDLIIRQAGVSRGTFYNYFRTNDELFAAVAREVSNELLRVVEPLVQRHADPAARVACGLSSTIRLAKAHPLLAGFIVRGGPAALSAGSLVTDVVPRDVRLGIDSGRFTVTDERVAFDLILGAVISAFHTVLTREVSDGYVRGLVEGVLRSLGLGAASARKVAAQDFGEACVPEDSLFSTA